MEKLAPLLRDVRKFSVWQFDMLCDWFAYFWNRGTISFVIDQEGQAHGVCAIKFFRNLEQFLEPFVHEPCGRFCMIELMVAKSPAVMGSIFTELTDRWGEVACIMWDRYERTENGAPRMWTWAQFKKLARRITNG
jgi:hypothetical protein